MRVKRKTYLGGSCDDGRGLFIVHVGGGACQVTQGLLNELVRLA